ncbi:MAG: DNA polymerase III subunit epsilon, partial [Methylococcales bacterium]|nr:DNA polymerase III subunit epsilon [Methylococcales bacterium]
TGNHFHVYINPERTIDDGAIAVHGISNEFLEDKPLFSEVVENFIAFTKGAELIIHNAPFDVGFLNHEYNLLEQNLGKIEDYSTIFDSLSYARKKHPGQRNSLDALCKRYGINNSHRTLHGALLDAEILAEVYLLMTGGQFSLLDDSVTTEVVTEKVQRVSTERPQLKVLACRGEELQAHQSRLQAITKMSEKPCLWTE